MAGLGTIFIGLMALANVQRFRGRLETSRPLLWVLMLAFPFPFIANTAGWMTTELGRQPWLIYGLVSHPGRLQRRRQLRRRAVHADRASRASTSCSASCILYLVGREILHGPDATGEPARPGCGPSLGEPMVELWFGLLCFTLIVFVVLDGWNIGAGMLH